MAKKDKKKRKKLKCIDCDQRTDDYYKIATNRGDIIKCNDCYELWVWRSVRMNYTSNNNTGKSSLQDEN